MAGSQTVSPVNTRDREGALSCGSAAAPWWAPGVVAALVTLMAAGVALGQGAEPAESPTPRSLQVLTRYPTRDELAALTARSVDCLVLNVARYPQSTESADLASFNGRVLAVIDAGSTPGQEQAQHLAELKGEVALILRSYPGFLSVDYLIRLPGRIGVTLIVGCCPSRSSVEMVNSMKRPVVLVMNGDYPDTWAVDELNRLNPDVRLVFNVQRSLDVFVAETLNKLGRPGTFYVSSPPMQGGGDPDAVRKLRPEHTIVAGRTYTAETVVDRLVGRLEPR
ncbi:MAG: hypothetical protein HY815_17980 [Candidatus Riflebacteria bacterium]|nr:hypothetical protein [Candidatus Riflebacteria bacterium]